MTRKDSIDKNVVVRCFVKIALFPRVIPTQFIWRHEWASFKLSKFFIFINHQVYITLKIPVGVRSQLTLVVGRVDCKVLVLNLRSAREHMIIACCLWREKLGLSMKNIQNHSVHAITWPINFPTFPFRNWPQINLSGRRDGYAMVVVYDFLIIAWSSEAK